MGKATVGEIGLILKKEIVLLRGMSSILPHRVQDFMQFIFNVKNTYFKTGLLQLLPN